jgi:drug/metabolite transporter (DMT)-like permease
LFDQLKLHGVVLAWGLTAVIGVLIHLPALEIVVWRTAMAAAALTVIAPLLGGRLRVPGRTACGLLASGALIGGHWMFFFAAGKVSNATITVAALPTTLIWSALLEWWWYGKRPRPYEVVLGLLMIPAVWVMVRFEFRHSLGFWFSIGAAVVGSVFAVLNGRLAQRHHYATITFYQMLGACLSLLPWLLARGHVQWPSPSDLGWLLVLSLVCTVYAFTMYVELLRRVSVFAVNLVYNLEPLYAMGLASLFLGEHRELHPGFFLGVALMIGVVIAHPFLKRRDERRPPPCPPPPAAV